MIIPTVGHEFEYRFTFKQSDVVRFAELTGDTNPIHLDATYASTTDFKKPIIHGFLSGSVFSKVFGTVFPGLGTIYLKQDLVFKRPMFVDESYLAKFTITQIDSEKYIITINCQILNEDAKVCLEGESRLLNKLVFDRI